MGASSSKPQLTVAQQTPIQGVSNDEKIKLYVRNNDIKNCKESLNFITIFDWKIFLVEAITQDRHEIFNLFLSTLSHCNDLACNRSVYNDIFAAVVRSPNTYYGLKVIQQITFLFDEITQHTLLRNLLQKAFTLENKTISQNIILEAVKNGSSFSKAFLNQILGFNNIEMVCMMLYYGAYTNDSLGSLTCLMYAMLKCSNINENIQRLLLDYEVDLNATWEKQSLLFIAIETRSPIILEIIQKGADVNYHNENHNIISLAMCHKCPIEIFKILWEKFNYNSWKLTYNKSVLLSLLESNLDLQLWTKYLEIILANETKLKSDLEYHNNSRFFHSNFLISKFYVTCLEKGLEVNFFQNLVFHLLSHGANIFKRDLDIIYNTSKANQEFLDMLLFMDLKDNDCNFETFMYFKYSPAPDLNLFISSTGFIPFMNSIKKLSLFYSIDMQRLSTEDEWYPICMKIFDKSTHFPSLLQLSRDLLRKTICSRFNIKNSCEFYTILKYMNLPSYIVEIISLNKCIYHE